MNFVVGPQSSYVQFPRLALLLNGSLAPYPLSAQIQTNNYSEAARFEITIACTPDEAVVLELQTEISVQVQATVQSGAPTTLIYGRVDTLDFDPLVLVMTLSGRDLIGLMLDTPTEKSYQNLTGSQIVESFVEQYSSFGMTGNITTTDQLTGRFYGINYAFTIFGQLYRATNQWNLVLFLAQMEGFIARMDGQTLYFGPPPPETKLEYEVIVDYGPPISSNAEKIQCVRSLTLAKDVQVTVLSWNSMLMRPVKRVMKSSSQLAPKGGYGPTQQYVFYKPDLSPDQALLYAKNKLTEITQRERVLDITIPGELNLTPASRVRLSGTGTGWDQSYYVDHIIREISFEHGFRETLRLKNISPSNQVVVE